MNTSRRGEAAPVADPWRNLADSALAACRRGESKEALAILQDGRDAARQTGETRGEIVTLNAAALVHTIRGDFWASLASGMDGFFLARRESDPLGMAYGATMLSGSMILLTPTEHEVELLEYALRIGSEHQDCALQIRVHNLLGIVKGDRGLFDAAEGHFDMANVLAGCERYGYERWRIDANLANLYRKRADAARARADSVETEELTWRGLNLIGRVEDESRVEGNLPILLDALGIGGLLLRAGGRHEQALARFEGAWTLAIKRKHRTVLPFLGIEIGKIALGNGRIDSAELTLLEAMREATYYRPSPKAAGLCELLARTAQMRGDGHGETHWLKEAELARQALEELRGEIRRRMAQVAEMLSPYRPQVQVSPV